jgi:hypothetical protein
MPDFKFNLGDIAEDKITKFQGVVVARSQWLNQCNTYSLQSTELHDGCPVDRQHFDEPQLKLVQVKVHKKTSETGGPHDAVPQTNRL